MLITDMTMPKMTGEKLAAEVRKIPLSIPIILCTGFSRNVNAETCSKAGIDAILMKPFNLHDLSTTVRKLLDDKGSQIRNA